jgi:ribonuclease E
MSKNMLLDSAHAEEIRVALVDGEKLDKFDFETSSKTQIKGNIYLAKIVRVEPSLQAAFVDYGADRHGFLSFSEIHCDYFQIPVGDRRDLENHIQNAISALLTETGESVEDLDPQKISKLRYQFYRRYKIQEVIRKRQVVLIQAVKEERGGKGAALTTYISLTGRYCAFMPNMSKGSGVSRKILGSDRTKIKKIIASLPTESGSVVIRTAGSGRSKAEIRKDFDYLKKMWDEIRETTVKSIAPCLIHEEAGIIKRAIRDWHSRDVETIFVEGEEGYKIAKSFVKKLMPGQAKKVKLYDDAKIPLFNKFKINSQINQIYSTRANLPSGGYLIINPTEALISIDVNSGKSIRERNISETALKTNLEAAAEIARQCRLRDLGGLIVVDFIDMTDRRANSQVEKCLRDALREDKARIQIGAISHFGLLEFSRQRLRASVTEANTTVCPCCGGTGFVWSDESVAIQILRKIEETLGVSDSSEITVSLSTNTALYLMNKKRSFISQVEERTNSKIIFKIDDETPASEFKVEATMRNSIKEDNVDEPPVVEKPRAKEAQEIEETNDEREDAAKIEPSEELKVLSSQEEKSEPQKRRRPRRRKRSGGAENSTEQNNADETVPKSEEVAVVPDVDLSSETDLPFEEDANATELTESYKKQETAFDLFPEEQVPKEEKKSGWWQKLLKKSDAEDNADGSS